MNDEFEKRIVELESKIQILERENETLSLRAEENLLLSKAFQGINSSEDIDSLLDDTLESISILLNISFTGIFDLINDKLYGVNTYCSFDEKEYSNVHIELDEQVLKHLLDEHYFFQNTTIKDQHLKFVGLSKDSLAVLIIALRSESVKNRFVVFANEFKEDISEHEQILEKIIDIISSRIDKIYYQTELETLNEELENKVKQRTEELTIAKNLAEESDRLKTAFLQNMSHEIRTPMNAIMGFSCLLPEFFDNRKELEKYTELIQQRSGELLDLINDLMDVAKIESGEVKSNFEEFKLLELFNELEHFFRAYQQRNVKKDIDLCMHLNNISDSDQILTDKTKLKQIFVNLVTNAYKFTKEGKIEIACRKRTDGHFEFYVEDTGIGIPSSLKEKIFDRFTQLNENAWEPYGGTGLGLTIVKGYIEILGGKISLQSEENVGSKFIFNLPGRIIR